MNTNFDFVGSEDKPALIAFATSKWLEIATNVLQELGYKVHVAETHSDFIMRFSQIHYQVVLLEELFGADTPEENLSLKILQQMTMKQRRHATVLLVGNHFQTFSAMEAYRQSVHAVMNGSELSLLKELVEKTVSDNNDFLQNYRDAQKHVLTRAVRD
jgi:DNA-binding NtrC family response regulator